MFRKFPSIEQLHTISKEALKYNKAGDITFTAQIKLHGTNACVRIHPDGKIVAQKRSSDITPENDNFGFAQWVKDNTAAWARFRARFDHDQPSVANQIIYIYGEWAGQGIQKSDAVSKIPTKSFFVFSIISEDGTLFTILPDKLNPLEGFRNAYAIPTFKTYTLNFFNPNTMDAFVADVTKDIEEIAKVDPYIKAMFGIEDAGEGLVFTPTNGDVTLIFKLKTEAHAENKRADKQIVAYSPETVAELNQFADKFVTEPRLNQALMELGIQDTYSIKDTGRFIGWVCQDIHKECPVELEASGLDWKSVAAVVTQKARMWFLGKVK